MKSLKPLGRLLKRLGLSAVFCTGMVMAQEAEMELTPDWEYVADTVMGGVSTGQVTNETVQGRMAHRLTGSVSTDNNGGFVQMAFDVQGGAAFDASPWSGLEIEVRGNGEVYDLRLRTDQLSRPWQSFRTEFTAPAEWTTLQFPFDDFQPNKTDATFDAKRLKRIGVLAIGRVFEADVSVSSVRFYR